uniref:Transglutaminase-like domain-containing protein n=1 Tax=Leptobrachium leishanense TaxID=445787 RepID=A0A8C5MEF2_9ANUR
MFGCSFNYTWQLRLKELLRDGLTELEKTRVIWIWICHHIEYDTKALKNAALRTDNPEDILRMGRGVCAGYSSLFQRMCRIAGVQCKTVSGYGKGAGYTVGQKIAGETNHAWNMVYLEGTWHLLDSTWGAGTMNSGTDKFTFQYNEFYFLTHPALFIESHLPENADCQLLEPHVSKNHFKQMGLRESYFYSFGLLSSEPDKGIIETVNGKASITVESRQHMQFIFNLNKTENTGLVTYIENKTRFDVYPQKPGKHVLDIFANKSDSERAYTFVSSYIIDCKSVDTTIKFPKCLQAPNAPSWYTEKQGLFQPSHPHPIISTKDGCCAVSFTLKWDISVFCTLECDDLQMTSEMTQRHIFQSKKEERIEFKVRLPRSGTYVLNMNFKEENSENYTCGCSYLIVCTNPSVHWPVFPEDYTAWSEHHELVEPLDGILTKNKNVFFKLHVPGVTGLSVQGTNLFPLTLSDQGYWEGICDTGNCSELYVACAYKETPNTLHYMLKYQVQ